MSKFGSLSTFLAGVLIGWGVSRLNGRLPSMFDRDGYLAFLRKMSQPSKLAQFELGKLGIAAPPPRITRDDPFTAVDPSLRFGDFVVVKVNEEV